MSRRRGSGGFAMAEALVSLAVAALTLALLTGAGWGLRLVSESRAAAAQTGAADWLAARRALQGWAAGLTSPGLGQADGAFAGTATTARMVVDSAASGRPAAFVAELRVEQREEGFVLIAARHLGQRDARVASEAPQETEIVRTDRPIRLLYLLPREGVAGLTWRYETGGGALPAAIAVEVGDTRAITARVFANRSAVCVSGLGPGGLEDPQCILR